MNLDDLTENERTMIKKLCDGCETEFTERRPPALTIERSNGMSGGLMPDTTAHLCDKCGPIAWWPIRQMRRERRDDES